LTSNTTPDVRCLYTTGSIVPVGQPGTSSTCEVERSLSIAATATDGLSLGQSSRLGTEPRYDLDPFVFLKKGPSRRVLVGEQYETARLVRDAMQLPAGRSCSTDPSCIMRAQHHQLQAHHCTQSSATLHGRLSFQKTAGRRIVQTVVCTIQWWACAFKISRCASRPLLAASFAPAS
jgi:hypothetical protein